MATEKDITIALPDGQTEAVLITPAGAGPWPGVIYLTDIGGIRPAQRQAASRLCDAGYVVLLPNVFYRVSKVPVMDVIMLRQHPEAFQKRIAELTESLTPDALERDAKGYVDYLDKLPDVKAGKLGAVGFCFCGAMALRIAAACPDKVLAAASFHGGHLYVDKPTSPHLLLPNVKACLLFGHASGDRSMPAEAIKKFDRALKDWGGRYESETYEGSLHGWTTLDSPVYNPTHAARAFQKLTELFAETLA